MASLLKACSLCLGLFKVFDSAKDPPSEELGPYRASSPFVCCCLTCCVRYSMVFGDGGLLVEAL